MHRGVFILLEGVDGSGKTTQSERLLNSLKQNGYQAIFQRFPDRTTVIGKILNEYLGNKLGASPEGAHLLFSANRWESQQSIQDALNTGIHVVCDRYAISGVAYSVGAMGLSEKWCLNADEGLIAPDLVIHLSSESIKTLLDRKDPSAREKYEIEDVQKRVSECYTAMEFRIKANGGDWCNVDALNSIEEVSDEIYKAAIEIIKKKQNMPVRHLWDFG